jgi:tetratricopeptide (TPR) repeat protein
MKVPLFCLVVINLISALPVFSQQTAYQRSHAQRFSSPEVRAEMAEADASKKLASNPKDVEALATRALARMRLGHYAEAYDDLRLAVTLRPADADYQANMGYVLWKLARPAEAVAAERAALKLDDKSFSAHYQLGRFLLRGADPKQLAEATVHLKRALELDPRQYDVRFEMIALFRLLGDTAAAMAQLDVLEDARPSDPRVTYVGALLAADRGDFTTAVNSFRDALRSDPSLYGAWQDLGLAYIKSKRWPEAADTFAELARRQPDSVDAAYFRALALFNTGRVAEAEREARRALQIDAGASAAHTLLGIILGSRGENSNASDELSQAAALDPRSFDAYFNLGRVQYCMKDYTTAAASLRTAVSLDPQHAEARFFLGTVLETAGQSAAALAEYQELNKIDPQSAIGLVGLGALLVKQGKNEEAISALTRSTILDSTRFEAHWALGRALVQSERLGEAVDSFRAAIALSPDRADAHYQLGLALRRLGRAEEAAREFALVEKINREFRTSRTANQ